MFDSNIVPLQNVQQAQKQIGILGQLTQGYHDVCFDNVSVNFGALLSLNDLTPSSPSLALPSNLIILESMMWFSSILSPGYWSNALAYATAT